MRVCSHCSGLEQTANSVSLHSFLLLSRFFLTRRRALCVVVVVVQSAVLREYSSPTVWEQIAVLFLGREKEDLKGTEC